MPFKVPSLGKISSILAFLQNSPAPKSRLEAKLFAPRTQIQIQGSPTNIPRVHNKNNVTVEFQNNFHHHRQFLNVYPTISIRVESNYLPRNTPRVELMPHFQINTSSYPWRVKNMYGSKNTWNVYYKLSIMKI